MLTATIKRLAQSRMNAGLKPKQADRVLCLPEGTTEKVENEDTELSLRLFLLMCEAYGVSSVWVLTGVNPAVNVTELQLMLVKSQIAKQDMEMLIELLQTIPEQVQA